MFDNSAPLIAYHISPVRRQSFFPFQNNLKNLDPPYKTDLDLLDCLGRVKLHRADFLVICNHSREEPTLSYSRINMVNEFKQLYLYR